MIQVTTHLYWYGNERLVEIRRHLRTNLVRAVNFYKDRLKERISQWGSISYKGGRFRIKHSLPGQPPLRQTSNYYNSIKAKTGYINGEVTGEIYTDVAYASALELGGMLQIDQNDKIYTNWRLINPITKAINIAPRPIWMPTFYKALGTMIQIILGDLTSELSGKLEDVTEYE